MNIEPTFKPGDAVLLIPRRGRLWRSGEPDTYIRTSVRSVKGRMVRLEYEPRRQWHQSELRHDNATTREELDGPIRAHRMKVKMERAVCALEYARRCGKIPMSLHVEIAATIARWLGERT